jgi:hypothetical protein
MSIRTYPPPGCHFYAWCDDANRVDAFAAALSALAPGGKVSLSLPLVTLSERVRSEEAIAALRAHFPKSGSAVASFQVAMRSERLLAFSSYCHDEESEIVRATGPMKLTPSESGEPLPRRLVLAPGTAPRSVETEAAIACMLVEPDVEDLLLRFCTSPHVATGGCAAFSGWKAPVELAATYHADAATIARDLALSWVHLHDGQPVERVAGLSMGALRSRVETGPVGATIPIATEAHRLAEQNWRSDEHEEPKQRHALPERPKRVALPGDAEVSREQILAALSTPPATLLEALEAAAAAPDEEWQVVEPLAREMVRATATTVPTYEVAVTTKHVRFLEQHAPYHVRRLPNGGVMLATHPYRILWPLWADALHLLDIR